jgi:hypothetical protein
MRNQATVRPASRAPVLRSVTSAPLPRHHLSLLAVVAAVAPATTRPARLSGHPRMPFMFAAERANMLDLIAVDGAPRDDVAQLCERTLLVLEYTINEIEKLDDACEVAAAAESESEDEDDEDRVSGVFPVATVARGSALRGITDLAFLGAWTLQRARASVLDAVAGGDTWSMVGACSSAKQEVLESAVAIEQALADDAGVPSDLAELVALGVERSLRARALYRTFRAAVRPDALPSATNVESRMRAATLGLVRLCDPRHAEDLHLQDRILFHQHRAAVELWRSRQWLPGATNNVVADTLRQWKKLAELARGLQRINDRSELREHDDRVARAALASLAEHEDCDTLAGDVPEALGSLLGRDDGLDALLLSLSSHRVGELRDALERLG